MSYCSDSALCLTSCPPKNINIWRMRDLSPHQFRSPLTWTHRWACLFLSKWCVRVLSNILCVYCFLGILWLQEAIRTQMTEEVMVNDHTDGSAGMLPESHQSRSSHLSSICYFSCRTVVLCKVIIILTFTGPGLNKRRRCRSCAREADWAHSLTSQILSWRQMICRKIEAKLKMIWTKTAHISKRQHHSSGFGQMICRGKMTSQLKQMTVYG